MITNTAMILAAGLGKSLRPITENCPKPLIKVNQKALLGHAIDALINVGIKDIIVNTHYQPEQIKNYLASYYPKEKISITYEKELLDTGGGVKNAIKLFKEEFVLVINSDIFWNFENYPDLKKLLRSDTKNLKCNMLLSNLNSAYGILNRKGDFKFINNHLERNNDEEKGFYFSGAQLINVSIFKSFSNNKFSFNEIWDFLIKDKLLKGIVMNSRFLHLGEFEGFKYLKDFELENY